MKAIEELANVTLEECDQLADDVSVHAQRKAILHSAAAGVGGMFGAGPLHAGAFGRRDSRSGGSATATATP